MHIFLEHIPPHFYLLHLPCKSILGASSLIRKQQIQLKIPNRISILQLHLASLELILREVSKCEQSNLAPCCAPCVPNRGIGQIPLQSGLLSIVSHLLGYADIITFCFHLPELTYWYNWYCMEGRGEHRKSAKVQM